MHDDDLDRLAHLVRESRARSAVATLAAALTAEVRSFPTGQRAERLMARARLAAEVESRPRVSLVVRVIGQLIEVLGGAVSTAALVRGGTQDGVLVREVLGGYPIGAHIEVVERRFMVTLDLGAEAAARGVRVTLLAMAREGREMASEAATQGRVRLPEMVPGQWQVQLQDAAGWCATLDLDLVHHAA